MASLLTIESRDAVFYNYSGTFLTMRKPNLTLTNLTISWKS